MDTETEPAQKVDPGEENYPATGTQDLSIRSLFHLHLCTVLWVSYSQELKTCRRCEIGLSGYTSSPLHWAASHLPLSKNYSEIMLRFGGICRVL